MSVIDETRAAQALIERVEELEDIAARLPNQDDLRARLLALAKRDIDSAPGLRPRIAADLLGLSEKTVRAWVHEGVLKAVEPASGRRILLEPARVHAVLHLLRELRAAGRTTGLLDEVHRRLVDETWLNRNDLQASIAQMHRGEGTVRVPKVTD